MPDFKTETNGDLVIERGRIAFTSDDAETAKQNLLFRFQTDLLDYTPQPDIGIGVHRYIGQPNTARLGDAIKQRVIESLTQDHQFQADTFRVEVIPLAIDKVGVYLFYVPRFRGPVEKVTIAVALDLTVGSVSLITG